MVNVCCGPNTALDLHWRFCSQLARVLLDRCCSVFNRKLDSFDSFGLRSDSVRTHSENGFLDCHLADS